MGYIIVIRFFIFRFNKTIFNFLSDDIKILK